MKKRGSKRSWISMAVMALLLGWTLYTILQKQTPGQLACTFAVPCIVYRAFGLSGAGLWEIFSLQALCAISVNFLPLPGAAGAAESVFLRGFAAVFGAELTAPAMILTRTVNCYLVLAVTGIITAVGHAGVRKKN